MATRILHDEFDCFRGQEGQMDIESDNLLLRVFRRAGLIEYESENQARKVARRLNREFPRALNRPAWRIGQHWCNAKEPECGICRLTALCPKRI